MLSLLCCAAFSPDATLRFVAALDPCLSVRSTWTLGLPSSGSSTPTWSSRRATSTTPVTCLTGPLRSSPGSMRCGTNTSTSQWEPNDKAWQSYIKLEERYNELDRASEIYERWIGCRPIPKNWVTWAKYEEERGRPDKAREVFQTALEFFGDEEEQVEKAQQVFAAFARMETRLKEYERARVIYKFALARLPRSKSANRESHQSSAIADHQSTRSTPSLRSSVRPHPSPFRSRF
jgi:hypothetical protein